MAQWFAVTSEDPASAASWMQQASAKFLRIAGLRPAVEIHTGSVAAALFPSVFRPAGAMFSDASLRGWIGGAGAWFYQRKAREEGLRLMLLARPHEAVGLEAWMREADGPFAIVLSGFLPAELAVCTDRLGTIHAYSARVDGGALLCTSSLVLAALLAPELDPVALRHFFSYGNLFERRSMFRDISKLPPATVSRFSPGRSSVRETCYWRLGDVNFDRATQPGGVEAVAQALGEAIGTIGDAYERPILDLTGGFDSRCLLGAMLQTGRHFSTVVNGEASDSDVIVAGQLAGQFELDHRHRRRIDLSAEELLRLCHSAVPLVDGEYDLLHYAPTLRIQIENASAFQATINGSNGEICKGHWWEILFPHIGRHGHFDSRTVAASRFATKDVYPHLLAVSYSDSLVDDLTGVVQRATSEMVGMPNTALLDTCYLAMRMQRWQGRIASATSRVWPCISPFAFRAVMEAILATPPDQRVRHRLTRRLIEYQCPKLAAMPLAAGYPAMPVRWDTIHRFGPLAVEVGESVLRRIIRGLGLQRTRGPLTTNLVSMLWGLEEVRDCLSPRNMRTRALYRPETLDRVLQRARIPGAPEAQTAGRVLSLELTARRVEC